MRTQRSRTVIFGGGGGSSGGLQQFFNQASFFLPLDPFLDGSVNTVPAIATGSATATFTRSGATAWTRDRNGTWIGPIGANIARSFYSRSGIYLGYLAEGQRVNHFKNSNAPATQTSPSLGTGSYTLWMEGSGSVAVAANSATITGAGTATDGAPVTFAVTVAGTVDYTVTGTPTIVQAENGAFASSYIQTAGASVTRNADVLTYASAGNTNDASGAAYAEITSTPTAGSNTVFVSVRGAGATGGQQLFRNNINGRLSLFDGTAIRDFGSSMLLTSPISAITKIASSWGGSVCNGAVAGLAGVPATFDGSMNAEAAMGIGVNSDTNGPMFGTIRNVRIWTTQLSDAVLRTITT